MAKAKAENHGGSSRRGRGRQDWIGAALESVVAEGPAGFRVARLARRLGVTSASFYWHFEDRDELRDAVLSHWMDRMLRPAAADARQANPVEIHALLRILEKRGLPRVDAAMRRWAAEDPVVAKAVTRADLLRHRVVARTFEAEGLTEPQAKQRAELVMWAFRGSDGVEPKRRAKALRELIDALLHHGE